MIGGRSVRAGRPAYTAPLSSRFPKALWHPYPAYGDAPHTGYGRLPRRRCQLRLIAVLLADGGRFRCRSPGTSAALPGGARRDARPVRRLFWQPNEFRSSFLGVHRLRPLPRRIIAQRMLHRQDKAFSPIPNHRPSLEIGTEKRESGRKLAHESVAIGKKLAHESVSFSQKLAHKSVTNRQKLAHVFVLPGKMTLVHSIPDCTGGEADDLSGAYHRPVPGRVEDRR